MGYVNLVALKLNKNRLFISINSNSMILFWCVNLDVRAHLTYVKSNTKLHMCMLIYQKNFLWLVFGVVCLQKWISFTIAHSFFLLSSIESSFFAHSLIKWANEWANGLTSCIHMHHLCGYLFIYLVCCCCCCCFCFIFCAAK